MGRSACGADRPARLTRTAGATRFATCSVRLRIWRSISNSSHGTCRFLDFTNYQALLDRVIRERLERVYGDPTVQAAERIAAEMAAEEDLTLARARFPGLSTEIANLESAGILVSSDDGLRVSFRHQTLFDVLRARFFLRGASSLADFVTDHKQQSLFVRPTVWSTLSYLRASDTPAFRKEFLRLWRNDVLRLHLRYLLISFLGQGLCSDRPRSRLVVVRARRSLHSIASSLGHGQ